jgi:hypothetical protein
LNSQLEKLINVSSSPERWRSSPYGGTLEFGDLHTLSRVAEVWRQCLLDSADTAYQFNFKHAKLVRTTFVPEDAVIYTGIRNASPLGLECLTDIQSSYQNYHEHGGRFESERLRDASTIINPTIFATGPRRAILHYGSDPLLSFHSAAAYAPLTKSSPLKWATGNNARAPKPLIAAQKELRS